MENKARIYYLTQTLLFVTQSNDSFKKIHRDELVNFTGHIVDGINNEVHSEDILLKILPLICRSSELGLLATTIASVIACDSSRAAACVHELCLALQQDFDHLYVGWNIEYPSPEFAVSIILAIFNAGSFLRYGEENNETNINETYVTKVYNMMLLLSSRPAKEGLISKILDYYTANYLQILGKMTHLYKTVFIELAGQNYLPLFYNFSKEVNFKKFYNKEAMYLKLIQEIADKIFLSLDVIKKYQSFHQLQFLK
jgi:hypothetical protein